jgi:hypothetical protein
MGKLMTTTYLLPDCLFWVLALPSSPFSLLLPPSELKDYSMSPAPVPFWGHDILFSGSQAYTQVDPEFDV